jgi:DNA (cytosine-5)-methyltransferase 1
MNELALFAGAGGGILGGHLLNWRTVCAVECEPYPASVLMQRQNDGLLPPFPIWDDVCTFDGRPWRGLVDVVSGGFPCQDISSAGKGAGIEGARSSMWKHMARIIGEVRPRFVFVENSPMLVSRGLAVAIGDLAALGYDTEWSIVSASDVGAPHKRDRIWIVGHSNSNRKPNGTVNDEASILQNVGYTASERQPRQMESINSSNCAKDRIRKANKSIYERIRSEWPTEPRVGRVADGVAARMDRLKAIGNGQVPRVAAAAFDIMI